MISGYGSGEAKAYYHTRRRIRGALETLVNENLSVKCARSSQNGALNMMFGYKTYSRT